MGRIDPLQPITMRTLWQVGLYTRLRDGVKLLGRNKSNFRILQPLRFEVSQVSKSAREIIETAGGSVTTIYFNKLGLKTFVKTKLRKITVRFAGAPPKLKKRFDLPRYHLEYTYLRRPDESEQ